MNTVKETQKRLKIAKNIAFPLKEIVKGILLGGSMGYGQNYSVTDKSDIDMVVVCNKQKIRDLEATPYFSGYVPREVLRMFEQGIINLFWVTKEVRGVEVNTFIYETQGYINFCLSKGKLVGYSKDKPSETQIDYGFSEEIFEFKRNVKKYGESFIYEKPALINGKFWAGVPKMDFLYSAFILYEKDNFFTNLEKHVWKRAIEKLIEEYGKTPCLNKVNILNTHFIYQTAREKLPQKVIDKITERTKKELDNYLKENV